MRTLVLVDVQRRLQSFGRSLSLIRLSVPSEEELEDIIVSESLNLPVLIKEELDFDTVELKALLEDRLTKFTKFDTVLEAIKKSEMKYVFIDARGGTGKTYVLNAILSASRILENGSVALAVGSTGIAADLLQLGRTFHSRFKAPLNVHKDSVCSIDAQSTLARLISMAKVIVWDEAPMADRYLMEALDRTLRDITSKDLPFGGKVMLLSGDFRQCLPVLPNGSRAEVVDRSLKRSHLWKFFKVMKLEENMRVKMSNDPEAEEFDIFTLKL